MIEAIGRRLLFCLDPETAHRLSILALKSGLVPAPPPPRDPRLAVKAAGLDFPNPLGMAAGYDKNAEVPDALLRLGFGFAEAGTVTPQPQPGNPRPRLFRLEADDAVINRLGFNNEGHEAAAARLAGLKRTGNGLIGLNIGANKNSTDRMADYEAGVRRFAPLADYLTVNISSPNTPGLRDMQARQSLSELLGRVVTARREAAARPPIFLKIAPDLDEASLEDVAAEVLAHGIDGLIISNTTLSRAGLKSPQSNEAGGVSGRPLFERSTAVLARMRKLVGKEMAIIGAGGVSSAETALEKIRAGADLVQIYTGLIYGGPLLPARILRGILRHIEREGLSGVSELRDTRLDHWTAQPFA